MKLKLLKQIAEIANRTSVVVEQNLLKQIEEDASNGRMTKCQVSWLHPGESGPTSIRRIDINK